MSIQSEIERLTGAKNDIATSIENQGVTVPSDALLSDMSSLIDQITGDVTSVNGQTGDVVLSAADVGALASDVTYVESVNGSSGAVTIVVPSGASEVPQDLGVAAVGSSSDWARADHVHSIDTSRAASDLGISGASMDDFVKIAAVDANGKPTAFSKGTPPGGDVTSDMLGIVIDGNSTPVGAAVEQYVIVKNSTISGITDGLYIAAKAIPANTTINSTYLTKVSGGGLNNLRLSRVRIPIARGQSIGAFENKTFVSTQAPFNVPNFPIPPVYPIVLGGMWEQNGVYVFQLFNPKNVTITIPNWFGLDFMLIG